MLNILWAKFALSFLARRFDYKSLDWICSRVFNSLPQTATWYISMMQSLDIKEWNFGGGRSFVRKYSSCSEDEILRSLKTPFCTFPQIKWQSMPKYFFFRETLDSMLYELYFSRQVVCAVYVTNKIFIAFHMWRHMVMLCTLVQLRICIWFVVSLHATKSKISLRKHNVK